MKPSPKITPIFEHLVAALENETELDPHNQVELQTVLATNPELGYNGEILFYQRKPFSGYIVDFHPNLTLRSRSFWIRGQREGLSESWNEDGTSVSQLRYRDNQLTHLENAS